MRNGWMAAALLFGGCEIGTPTLVDGFEADLTTLLGCGDLSAYAVDADDEVMITVQLDGPLAAANGQETESVVTLPDPATVVRVEIGSKISDAACDDVIENGGANVAETWDAISGTVTVGVHPAEGDDRADVTLEDVVFESPDGEEVTVNELKWTDLSVGWFPG
jgi:hypothetical protein